MRYITDTGEVQRRLWQMSLSVAKDVASWKGWSLVEIKPLGGDDTINSAVVASQIRNLVREVVAEKESALLQLDNGWNYLMCKHWKSDDLSRLRDALQNDTSIMTPSYSITAYNL